MVTDDQVRTTATRLHSQQCFVNEMPSFIATDAISGPVHTPERNPEDFALPTWTPLAVPSTSSNASESSPPSPPSTSNTHPTTLRSSRPSLRRAAMQATAKKSKAPAEPAAKPQTAPYDPSEEFRFPMDALRWLPSSVIPSGLIANTSGSSQNGQHMKRDNGAWLCSNVAGCVS